MVFVIPFHNAQNTLRRSVQSALRQQGVEIRVVVVNHGSSDDGGVAARELAEKHDEVELLELTRIPGEPKSPSRPLNEGLRIAREDRRRSSDRTWIFRLDADDFLLSDHTISDQLRTGDYRALIMATLIFFDERTTSAYEYGPRLRHRSLERLPGRDLYAVAHHATAMRLDLMETATPDGVLYDESLETGEDLGATIRLLRAVGKDERAFAFVDMPYCYKALDEQTITGSLPLRRVLSSHRKLLRGYAELSRFAVVRGLAELASSRLIGEQLARRTLQHFAGRNGHYCAIDFSDVAKRLSELAEGR